MAIYIIWCQRLVCWNINSLKGVVSKEPHWALRVPLHQDYRVILTTTGEHSIFAAWERVIEVLVQMQQLIQENMVSSLLDHTMH